MSYTFWFSGEKQSSCPEKRQKTETNNCIYFESKPDALFCSCALLPVLHDLFGAGFMRCASGVILHKLIRMGSCQLCCGNRAETERRFIGGGAGKTFCGTLSCILEVWVLQSVCFDDGPGLDKGGGRCCWGSSSQFLSRKNPTSPRLTSASLKSFHIKKAESSKDFSKLKQLHLMYGIWSPSRYDVFWCILLFFPPPVVLQRVLPTWAPTVFRRAWCFCTTTTTTTRPRGCCAYCFF